MLRNASKCFKIFQNISTYFAKKNKLFLIEFEISSKLCSIDLFLIHEVLRVYATVLGLLRPLLLLSNVQGRDRFSSASSVSTYPVCLSNSPSRCPSQWMTPVSGHRPWGYFYRGYIFLNTQSSLDADGVQNISTHL